MRWLQDLIKRAVVEVVTEVLEPRIRTIVREETDIAFERKWQEWEPRIRAIVREEFVNLEPHIRAIVREEIRVAMEEEWMPKLKLMWREDIQRLEERFQARFDALQVRLDTISETVMRFTEFRMREWVELEKEVKEIRSDLERVKAHIGLTGGNEP
ncbi:MAG: hypothetical protein N3B10_00110 [Armatimonadetes bacterium]|nr:hypothetical protein [Armatimonadota bacterium]